jgi:hypothetical protein
MLDFLPLALQQSCCQRPRKTFLTPLPAPTFLNLRNSPMTNGMNFHDLSWNDIHLHKIWMKWHTWAEWHEWNECAWHCDLGNHNVQRLTPFPWLCNESRRHSRGTYLFLNTYLIFIWWPNFHSWCRSSPVYCSGWAVFCLRPPCGRVDNLTDFRR